MTNKKTAAADPEETEMKNSLRPAYPFYDGRDGTWLVGLSKTEYLTLKLLAAHLQSHGKMPSSDQMTALIDSAIWILDNAIPKGIQMFYPTLKVDPESQLEELE